MEGDIGVRGRWPGDAGECRAGKSEPERRRRLWGGVAAAEAGARRGDGDGAGAACRTQKELEVRQLTARRTQGSALAAPMREVGDEINIYSARDDSGGHYNRHLSHVVNRTINLAIPNLAKLLLL